MRADDETTIDVVLIAIGVGAATFLVLLPIFVTPKVAQVVGEARLAAMPLLVRFIRHSPIGLGVLTIAGLIDGELSARRSYLGWTACFGVASAIVCVVAILLPMLGGFSTLR